LTQKVVEDTAQVEVKTKTLQVPSNKTHPLKVEEQESP